MIPRTLIDTAQIPGGQDELRLMQRGADFMITLGRNELMNSRMSGSEEALATLACDRMPPGARPNLLIGGLGMGFTLRAALGVLGKSASVTVVELVPEVIAWGRGPMVDLFAGCLDDPRVQIIEGDVGAVIQTAHATYDAILMDVDNGPDGLTRQSNNGLYTDAGLRAARSALRPGGVLTVWSSAPDARFVPRLQRAGFIVEEVVVRANGAKGARHVIWVAINRRA